MKRLIAIIAATGFATVVSAASDVNVYGSFADGNPDLSGGADRFGGVTAIQPGVGDSLDHYGGWANGNPDLFTSTMIKSSPSETPNIYGGFSGSPDL